VRPHFFKQLETLSLSLGEKFSWTELELYNKNEIINQPQSNFISSKLLWANEYCWKMSLASPKIKTKQYIFTNIELWRDTIYLFYPLLLFFGFGVLKIYLN